MVLEMLAALSMTGWQGTEWGMTPDETKAAVPSASFLTEEQRAQYSKAVYSALIGAPVESGKYKFKATFMFDNNKLAQIVLRLEDPAYCDGLKVDLRKKYGNDPIISDTKISAGLLWEDGDTSIEWSRLNLMPSSTCTVRYFPSDTANGSAL